MSLRDLASTKKPARERYTRSLTARQVRAMKKRGYDGRPGYGWGAVPPEVEAVFTGQFEKDPRATHPFRVSLLAAQAERFTVRDLRRCQSAVVAAHAALVSSTRPQSQVLETLLVKMLS